LPCVACTWSGPLYTVELDRGNGDVVVWEFYEDGVRFADLLEGVVEWAPHSNLAAGLYAVE
jgi:hypothetical protein